MTGLYGSDLGPAAQRIALLNGDVPIAVYGLGKMGLPVASVLADVTGSVVGADIDEDVVDAVRRGECPVSGEPGLPELLSDVVDAGRLDAVSDPAEAADDAAIHVVVVPTLVDDDGEVDLSALGAVLEDVAAGLDPGDTVCIESTVPPRTCADVVVPTLAGRSGLSETSFGVAFCPERTLSGRALEDIREAYPKVVGGVDEESTRVAALLYDEVTDNDVITLDDATTAEAMKVFSGVYRDVNIALANEFARYADAMEIDVRDAISAANSQPHSKILSPGPGVGGHCIPVYPHFLLSTFDVESPLTRVGRAVNESMPAFTVDLVRDALADAGTETAEATVLLLGTTYRPGVAETRNSPAVPIAEGLAKRGADVYSSDPLVDGPDRIAAEPVPLQRGLDLNPDAIVVVTPHEEFASIDWADVEPTIVVDCHDALDLEGTRHAGYAIGSPRARSDPRADANAVRGEPRGGTETVNDGVGELSGSRTVFDGGEEETDDANREPRDRSER
ncbi:nucleotide sugar dehydrogenase [Halobellus rufus]|uniref:nucleotide sugar dehydrogenase n=1 Tax=Halobellus rufus TaxID=1448860 RepID=UPI0009DFF467|nr:nucleotide sugar dehydrogenase [Halobellus rufus]